MCVHQRSDQITTFRIDRKTGLLTVTGRYTPVGTSLCITFLDVSLVGPFQLPDTAVSQSV
jgi:Lactonase, 7-bladed beta-propeller